MIYHVWITVSLPFDEGKFISQMVQRLYDISPAAEDQQLMLVAENATNAVVACKVEKADIQFREAFDEIADILLVGKINYYSLIISEFSYSSIWGGGNMNYDRLIKANTKKVVN